MRIQSLRVRIPTPRLGVRESFSKPAPRELVVLVMFGEHDRSVGEKLFSALKQVVSRHLSPPAAALVAAASLVGAVWPFRQLSLGYGSGSGSGSSSVKPATIKLPVSIDPSA